MQGPTGFPGVQTLPKSLQLDGCASPRRTLSQMQAECLVTCLNSIPNFFCASYCPNSFFNRSPEPGMTGKPRHSTSDGSNTSYRIFFAFTFPSRLTARG